MNDEIKIGSRYTKDGVSIDVHTVENGEVYVRKWPKGVETQAFFQNMLRVPIGGFLEAVKDATKEV